MTEAPADDDGDGDSDGTSRRWLIRLLIGLGIGIPVLIEARTFLGLLSAHLLGDGADGEPTPTSTATPEGSAGVGVGDELLSSTTPTDTVRDAQLTVQDSTWEFVLTVEVENTGDTPYSLRLGAVTTTEGDRIDGSASTGQIPAGESRTVTGTWSLPANVWPESVTVTALNYEGEDVEVIERHVPLERVSVSG